MVFFFTATGNSLYVAKQFDPDPISIPQIIHQDKLIFEDESIGIVCPTFTGERPAIIKEFMRKATFKTPYLYLIFTYGRSDSDAPEYADRELRDEGIEVNYISSILMVDNFLPSFDMDAEIAMNKGIDEQIAVRISDVRARKNEIPEAPQEGRDLHTMVKNRRKENPISGEKDLIVLSEKCNGCGICTKVCPLGSLGIGNGKAVRTSSACEFCLACAQNCPQKAVTIGFADKNPNARYRNEHISLQEVIDANNQNR